MSCLELTIFPIGTCIYICLKYFNRFQVTKVHALLAPMWYFMDNKSTLGIPLASPLREVC